MEVRTFLRAEIPSQRVVIERSNRSSKISDSRKAAIPTWPALRKDWSAYSQPSVSRTCLAHSSLVSAWYWCHVLQLPQLPLLNSFLKRFIWYPANMATDAETKTAFTLGETEEFFAIAPKFGTTADACKRVCKRACLSLPSEIISGFDRDADANGLLWMFKGGVDSNCWFILVAGKRANVALLIQKRCNHPIITMLDQYGHGGDACGNIF